MQHTLSDVIIASLDYGAPVSADCAKLCATLKDIKNKVVEDRQRCAARTRANVRRESAAATTATRGGDYLMRDGFGEALSNTQTTGDGSTVSRSNFGTADARTSPKRGTRELFGTSEAGVNPPEQIGRGDFGMFNVSSEPQNEPLSREMFGVLASTPDLLVEQSISKLPERPTPMSREMFGTSESAPPQSSHQQDRQPYRQSHQPQRQPQQNQIESPSSSGFGVGWVQPSVQIVPPLTSRAMFGTVKSSDQAQLFSNEANGRDRDRRSFETSKTRNPSAKYGTSVQPSRDRNTEVKLATRNSFGSAL